MSSEYLSGFSDEFILGVEIKVNNLVRLSSSLGQRSAWQRQQVSLIRADMFLTIHLNLRLLNTTSPNPRRKVDIIL